MFTDKSGQSATTGWAVIFVLLILVPTAIIFIIFNQVMTTYLVPEANELVLANPNLNVTQKMDMINDMNKYDNVWYFMPYAIIFTLILWLIINSMKRRPLEF